MGKLHSDDLAALLLAIAVMLVVSRLASEIGKKIGLPMVMGELLIGILLGPTLFGTMAPELYHTVFPFGENPAFTLALEAIVSLAGVLLLFVAGLELRLGLFLHHGRAAVTTGIGSMVLPFASGFVAAWYLPQWFGVEGGTESHLLFALFLGTAMAISALPVIARILLHMQLLKTEVGTVIIAAAVFNDIVGWLFFSFILSLVGVSNGGGRAVVNLAAILAFAGFMLVFGRSLVNRLLPWIQTTLSWPGGVLGLSLGLCLFSAAFTEYLHIHAILGAFIAGLTIGDSAHLREQAREIVHQFVTNFFAPLFFVSIGLTVNFLKHFDGTMVGIMLLLAFVGKVVGAGLGARLGGMSNRHALAVGFGLNARGAMEIILGSLAFQAGLINHEIYVALIVVALVTSISSAPLMRLFLGQSAHRRG